MSTWSPHPHTVTQGKIQDAEDALRREITVEQVRHVDLAEYQVGSEHFERLWADIAQQQASRWPSGEEI